MVARDVVVGPLQENELEAADRIFRLAFGTYLRLPDPSSFTGDASFVRTRWHAHRDGALAAHSGGELVGSNFALRWGRVGVFGPLSVRPDLWDRGVAQRLLAVTLERFESWGITHAGLFTFADSAKHVGLYQKFGFAPRFLTSVLSRLVSAGGTDVAEQRYSALPPDHREEALGACRELTGSILDGLDLTREIAVVAEHSLGETLLLRPDGVLTGFAICHAGAGSEAGSDVCYVKFGAVRAGADASHAFAQLLRACEQFAATRRASSLIVGVNTARYRAYRELLAHGFRTQIQGVAMQRPNEPGYNRPEVYVLDDWR